jgi:hypothetical protein
MLTERVDVALGFAGVADRALPAERWWSVVLGFRRL